MPDIDQSPKRRASDLLAEAATIGGSLGDSKLLLSLLQDILMRLETLERLHSDFSNAFPKNDLNFPDFDGHRRDHVNRIKAEKVMEQYKESATKSVIGWVVIFLAGLMASGLVSWLQAHLLRGTP